jgi:hypothetical protein
MDGGVIQWDLKMQFFTPSRSNICRVAQTDPFVILFIIWCWGRGLLLVFHPFFLFSPLHVFFFYIFLPFRNWHADFLYVSCIGCISICKLIKLIVNFFFTINRYLSSKEVRYLLIVVNHFLKNGGSVLSFARGQSP